MKTFVLNGKAYPEKEIGFNMICDLERMGLPLDEIEKNPMSMLRYYVSTCIGSNEEYAGKEIENHIINGGDLSDIAGVLSDAMDASGFFQALSKGTEKKATTRKKKGAEVVAITEV